MKITPYLGFNGQCEEAFRFYERVLGGKIVAMMPFEGTPAAEYVPAESRNQIMHACLQVGEGVLMASDAGGMEYQPAKGMHVSLHPTDPAEAERIFNALADGGTVQMPLEETFWAARFGMVVDRFGIPWMVNCDKAA